MPEQRSRYLSVSELSQLLKSALENALPSVSFQGEISEISRPQSGHVYFTVKDENAQISAVMWKGQAALLNFSLRPGLAVMCHGKPTIYEKSGRLQIVVHRMLPAGEGLLQQKFFELKKKLGEEGLFASERKCPLPFLPKAIGVLSSKSGAVIHDIMVKIRERMPFLRVYLVDVRVQGEGAAQEIADGIKLLNDSGLVEVIIIARGGGSLEDLWAFNEEITVRAIAASKVPVISGVGHEVDISLADLAADVRAPTPTAAAEMVVPRRDELLKVIESLSERLFDSDRWIKPKAQTLDEISLRMERAIDSLLKSKSMECQKSLLQLKSIEPQRMVMQLGQRLNLLVQRLSTSQEHLCDQHRHYLQLMSHKLEALSPKKVLERGFAVLQSSRGLVMSSKDVSEGESVAVLLAQGGLEAIVERTCESWNDVKRR